MEVTKKSISKIQYIDLLENATQVFIGILILFCVFIGAVFNKEIYALVVGLFLMLLLFFVTKTNKVFICKFLIVLLVFQNLLLGVGAHLANNMSSSLTYLTQFPTIMIFLFGGIYWFINYKVDFKNIIPTIMLLLLILSFVISKAAIFSKISYFRNFICFFFVYVIAKNTLINETDKTDMLHFLKNIGVVVTIIGFILMALPKTIWLSLGVREVYIAKSAVGYFDIVPGRFYTSIGTINFYRMASLYYEPINLSYLLVACLFSSVYLFFQRKSLNNIVSILILILGIIFTVGKGGYLICLLSIFMLLLHKVLKIFKFNHFITFSITIIGGLVFLWFFSSAYYQNFGASANPHFWAIISTFKNNLKNPIGVGLGNGGNMSFIGSAVYDSESDWLASGGETGLLGMTYQMGFQYLILVCIFFREICREISVSKYKHSFVKILFEQLPIILLLAFIFQENTFTPQCITPLMILLVSVINFKREVK